MHTINTSIVQAYSSRDSFTTTKHVTLCRSTAPLSGVTRIWIFVLGELSHTRRPIPPPLAVTAGEHLARLYSLITSSKHNLSIGSLLSPNGMALRYPIVLPRIPEVVPVPETYYKANKVRNSCTHTTYCLHCTYQTSLPPLTINCSTGK